MPALSLPLARLQGMATSGSPAEADRERFAARHPDRHAIHGEPPDDEEWSQRWALATPLPILDTLHVDTTGHVDLDAVADWCRRPR